MSATMVFACGKAASRMGVTYMVEEESRLEVSEVFGTGRR